MKRELMIPPDAESAAQSMEVFRGWVVDGQFQCSLFPTIWKDDLPSWGRFLADTAIHIANAIGEDTKSDPKIILEKIVSSFLEEIEESTGTHQGQFHKRDE